MPSASPVLVQVSERSFGLLDASVIPVGAEDDYSTGLVITMTAGARVHTGIHTGPVRAHVTVLTARPGDREGPEPGWSEIVEASVHAPRGSLRVDSLSDGPVPGLPLLSAQGPGWYRILVKARGRDTAPDGVVSSLVEDYEITIWPEPPSPSHIVQTQDRCGHGLRLAAGRRPAPPPQAPSNPYGSTVEEQRQAANLARLRTMGASPSPDPSPQSAAQPWKPMPDQPAPRPHWAEEPPR
ncbi:hypothetical protein ACFVYP_33155 [Kitasatospora sp. NPDC058201]|uniref:hypothetical protein n=1 Tax=unclassified Kitasatospora TaxID=2633591 RepID=UPI0036529EF2